MVGEKENSFSDLFSGAIGGTDSGTDFSMGTESGGPGEQVDKEFNRSSSGSSPQPSPPSPPPPPPPPPPREVKVDISYNKGEPQRHEMGGETPDERDDEGMQRASERDVNITTSSGEMTFNTNVKLDLKDLEKSTIGIQKPVSEISLTLIDLKTIFSDVHAVLKEISSNIKNFIESFKVPTIKIDTNKINESLENIVKHLSTMSIKKDSSNFSVNIDKICNIIISENVKKHNFHLEFINTLSAWVTGFNTYFDKILANLNGNKIINSSKSESKTQTDTENETNKFKTYIDYALTELQKLYKSTLPGLITNGIINSIKKLFQKPSKELDNHLKEIKNVLRTRGIPTLLNSVNAIGKLLKLWLPLITMSSGWGLRGMILAGGGLLAQQKLNIDDTFDQKIKEEPISKSSNSELNKNQTPQKPIKVNIHLFLKHSPFIIKLKKDEISEISGESSVNVSEVTGNGFNLAELNKEEKGADTQRTSTKTNIRQNINVQPKIDVKSTSSARDVKKLDSKIQGLEAKDKPQKITVNIQNNDENKDENEKRHEQFIQMLPSLIAKGILLNYYVMNSTDTGKADAKTMAGVAEVTGILNSMNI